jgi:Transmembrane secretion effector
VQHSFEGLDRPGGFARVELLRPLRCRDFRRLWAGQTVSLVGDGVFLIALAWAAYATWNAPAALAVIGIAMTVPTIALLLVGGTVSDRVDRRLVMVGSDVVRAIVVGGMTALSLAHALSFPVLAALTAVYGGATAFFTPAFESSVPCIVPEQELAQANSLDQFVRPAALRLVGPALGGWLVSALGADVAFGLDAATFVASAVAIASLGPIRSGGATPASTRAAIVDGLQFVRCHAWLWGTLLSAAIAYLAFLGPTEALLPYIVKNQLHASAGALGFVFAAGGVGAVGAAVVMAQVGQPKRDITFMYVVWTLATLTVAGYGLARSTAQLMLACLAFNALEVAGTVVWMTIKQRNVPRELLGRVSSLDWLISIGLLPLSFALVGPAVSLVGVRTTLVGVALIGAAATLGALFLPGMRDFEPERRPSPQPGRIVRDPG